MKKLLIATVCLMFAIHSADAYGCRRGWCGPRVYAPVYWHARPVVVGPAYYGYGPRYYGPPIVHYAPRVYVHGGYRYRR